MQYTKVFSNTDVLHCQKIKIGGDLSRVNANIEEDMTLI